MNLVDDFMEEEKSKCNWLDKLFHSYPNFYFADDINYKLKDRSIEQPFIVRPSKFMRFTAILFICFGLYFWFTLLFMIFQKILLPISIMFLFLTTSWIALIVWTIFLNPKKSYKIILDKEKIEIGKQQFDLSRISNYLLMEKGNGRHLISTLVLFIDNSEIFKYQLNYLNRSGKEIVKQIQLYKQCE